MSLELMKLAADLLRMGVQVEVDAKEVTEEHLEHVIAGMKSTVRVDTGATRDSITGEVTARGGVVTAEAGPTTPQAIYLEYGTATRAPVPFAGPVLENEAEDYVESVGDAAVKQWP